MSFYRWPAAISAILLSILSCLIVYSVAENRLYTQIFFFLIGIASYIFVKKIGWVIMVTFSPILVIINVLFLVLTLIFGATVRGSVRWLSFGLFSVQASEWIKFTLLLFLSSVVSAKKMTFFKTGLITLFFVLCFGLIFLQPDIGTALIVGIVFLVVFLLSVIRKRWKLLLIAFLIAAVPCFFPALKPYQQERIRNFLNPYHDPASSGYNVIQSVVAVGSGRLLGKGLGYGSQSQLKFLPERQTDFIFASLVEELGLVGGIVLIFIYGWLFWQFIYKFEKQDQIVTKMIVMGAGSIIFSQTVINIGMNLGVLPVNGLPLPFVSVGGNSILVTYMLIGLVDSLPYKKDNQADLVIG